MQAYKLVVLSALLLGVLSTHVGADEISSMESEIDQTSPGISSTNEGSFGFIEGAKEMKEATPDNQSVEVDKYEYEVVGGHMKAQVSKKQYDKRGRLLAFYSEDKMFGRADMAIKLRPARQPQSISPEKVGPKKKVIPRELPQKKGVTKRAQSDPKIIR